jgi:MerR family transcriptional regulator, copper efflux regulator
MNIGDIAMATGISAKMIRYYEETGLIRPATRAPSGYGVYSDSDLQTLRFVRRVRDLGCTVKQIDDLLTLWRDRTRASASVKEIAIGHVAALKKKMQELKDMSDTLLNLASNCHGGDRPDCPILETLVSNKAVAQLPKTRDRRNLRAFDRVR